MKLATVRDFRDRATAFFRSKEPIVILRRGVVAGVYFPQPDKTVPLELKREMYSVLSREVERQFKKKGITEKDLQEDFKAWRKKRRATRR